jgi:hypothetical protein
MDDLETIDILVAAAPAVDRMFPGARVANLITVAASELRNSLAAEIRAMARVFSEVDLTDTRYELTDVTFAVNVSAEGKVQVVGSVGASAGAGLTITLRRK